MAVTVKKSKLWRTIRVYCLECVCDVRKEVTLCTAPKCPLYPYRFGRTPRSSDPIYIEQSGNDYRLFGNPDKKWEGDTAHV